MKRVRVGLVVLAVLGSSAAASDAARSPTKTERAAIARALKVPQACAQIRVSSIDRRYASGQTSSRSACSRYATNTLVGLKRSGRTWRSLGGTNCESGPLPKMPSRVSAELLRTAGCR